ncbi:helix-turn-helix domain-containing protein [Sulfurospirillum cavolei]|uniref:helix-turn-helix domain-containing protein n=1 Tax=Sulfurospirillum cavolei TaxID=366522 RepID=UPI000A5397F1|nr:helix-turn-helix transcriptional regulator [Sulfurospirillum cavolei]
MKKTLEHFQQEIEYDGTEMRAFFLSVGRRIQTIRKKKGISQLELSNMLGFKSTSLIAGAESGYHNIKFSLEHLYKISKALNVSIKEFFDFE